MQSHQADARHILSLAEDEIPAFIRGQIEAKVFSTTMKSLNRELFSTDIDARQMAQTALTRLGFEV
ncbi:hypothetical protein AADZ90_017865 [Aestuariibius sp. 2305UL40-4]|uniref:hypothetical protein n=1 Tax=Aestuariibius violaceus TaxID=3234132 RepID=UPI00345E51F5